MFIQHSSISRVLYIVNHSLLPCQVGDYLLLARNLFQIGVSLSVFDRYERSIYVEITWPQVLQKSSTFCSSTLRIQLHFDFHSNLKTVLHKSTFEFYFQSTIICHIHNISIIICVENTFIKRTQQKLMKIWRKLILNKFFIIMDNFSQVHCQLQL